MEKNIIIKGAKENNLQNLDVTIPRDKMIVFTGLSGSGKSSLAFDTIYAEGQKKYMESLSSYARQFLGMMKKPDVESIEGLSPAISIDQKTTSKNPRSTVGTVTEIYDYLRLLYARIGIPHCPICGRKISSQSVDTIVGKIHKEEEGTKIIVMAPVIRGRKGEHKNVISRIRRDGYMRLRVDGEMMRLDEDDITLEKQKKHNIDIVIDRIVVKDSARSRTAEAVELAIKEGEGLVTVQYIRKDPANSKEKSEETFSTKFACPIHGAGIEELEPRTFSFNSPFGACDKCTGLGFTLRIPEERLVKDKNLSIKGGALGNVFGGLDSMGWYRHMLNRLAEDNKTNLDTPYKDLPDSFKKELLYGTGNRKIQYVHVSASGHKSNMNHRFEGLIPSLERRYQETNSEYVKDKIENLMVQSKCPKCEGKKLRPEVLAITVGEKNIIDVTEMSVNDELEFFNNIKLTDTELKISGMILKEIRTRLQFLKNVGLGYLTLSRQSATLSGGESQRIRLATQIGSGLVGVLYILGEPSIGLHQKDNDKLLMSLRKLTDMGNTLIIVEHDEDTMRMADHIVDIGPLAGRFGGKLVAEGTIDDIISCKESITGQYLSGKRSIPVPGKRREGNGKVLKIIGAKEHNLKNIDVEIPLGKFVCVTGVSGSGKSSLVNEIIYKGVCKELNNSSKEPGIYKEIKGIENFDKIIDIDQSPIGRTPRSNPATYTGMFTQIRELFSEMPEAKTRGYKPGRFSFNVKGGRCESCRGDGIIKVEMNFLPDVYVPCEVCQGARYNHETLEVKYKGKNIDDVLNMTVSEALPFFENHRGIVRYLTTLNDVGLGYIKLGQSSTQLSGGEAQRVKLATELSKRGTGNTLYILDEPTTGLHFADVEKLLNVINMLADQGNTVLVIEHNLDVIKQADYVIDLGPEGGDEGGEIVAKGTPEEVSKVDKSYTGQYLKKVLKKNR